MLTKPLLPTNAPATLSTYYDLVAEVEGYFTTAAVAACDAILAHQASQNVRGHLLEIGAWRGRSAILWLVHARTEEVVHLVDVGDHPVLRANLDRAAAALNRSFVFTKANSFLFPDAAFSAANRRGIRLVHIDGDHSGPGIWNDLNVCAGLLQVNGVMVADDFMNPHFPQVTEAVFAFLAQHRHEYALLGCGANKAFIVHTKFFDFWSKFVLNGLREALVSRLAKFDIYEANVNGRLCFGLR